ncbi:transposase [Thalassotalea loyana]|uniref:Transposase n=1 Tax=Thalassotalea loyana TaxID=280483 RepID=A0ABQ6HA25_9GAMM|nr:TniB family NTP-binding protein [Thalassotalea loyana]GLX84304.1 transposase [Thalassotalea loyana]
MTSIADKIEQIENIFVETPIIKEIMADIDEVMETAKIVGYSKQPDSILITGQSGMGKTTIFDHYLSKYPRVEQDEGDIVPILASTLLDDKSPKGAPGHMLRDLGDWLEGKGGTRGELTDRFVIQCNGAKVEAIFIDEFQNAIENGTDKIIWNTSEWIKTLINLTRRPVCLFGMPYSQQVIQANPALISRFPLIHHIEEYDTETANEWLDFLKEVDKQLPFDERANLSEPDLGLRLMCAAGGNLGRLMKRIIRPAAKAAVKDGSKTVTHAHLFKAIKKRLKLADNDNPLNLDISLNDFEVVHVIAETQYHKPFSRNPNWTYKQVSSEESLGSVLSKS